VWTSRIQKKRTGSQRNSQARRLMFVTGSKSGPPS
jgi:hypothetical protein